MRKLALLVVIFMCFSGFMAIKEVSAGAAKPEITRDRDESRREKVDEVKERIKEGKEIKEVYHLIEQEEEMYAAQPYSFVSEDGFQYYCRQCILISADGTRIPVEAGVWIVPGREGSGSFVVHSFHEKVHQMAQEIAQLYQNGQKKKAGELFRSFHDVTANMFVLLDELEKLATQAVVQA